MAVVIPDGVVGDYELHKLTPTSIEEGTCKLIADLNAILEQIVAIPVEESTYDNVMKLAEDYYRELQSRRRVFDTPAKLLEDEDVRSASNNAKNLLDDFDSDVDVREDLFQRYSKIQESEYSTLSDVQKRFVNKLVRTGTRNGLHLGSQTRKQMSDMKKKISELCNKFSSNLDDDNTKLYFSKEQLAGMSEDFIKELKPNQEGLLELTIKYDHLTPILKMCKVPETRKAMTEAGNRKCVNENKPILEEVITVRHALAELLGYKNHAAYMLEEKMAKTPEVVSSFLQDLKEKLMPLVEKERDVMLMLKEKECSELGIPNNGRLDIWDRMYYMVMVEETQYMVDRQAISEYFPLSKVLSGMFEIYQNLLGLTFTKVENAPVWHEDVTMHRVNDQVTSETLGYFYLDLHPRKGKYAHEICLTLQPSCIHNGKWQPSVSALVCNFTKPTADKPALLDHDEVVSTFHEFGHAMHNVCSRTVNAIFCGLNVSRDFIEAPSQMLENWAWQKESLILMSEHYSTKLPIPDDMLTKLTLARNANAGHGTIRQVCLSTFDQEIHRTDSCDVAELYATIQKEIMGYEVIPGTCLPAAFPHPCGGYDCQYYVYIWAEVFAADMFETKFEGKVLDAQAGRDYRQKILELGDSVDAMELMKDFLGRETTAKAYSKLMGLSD